ncbi:MAG: hypothetical protein DSZ06_00360 [Sulfurospirillum sp.]|nr:MAG: hypothetical protein DSZ06_00360 [Sulfurospirillum sp.]
MSMMMSIKKILIFIVVLDLLLVIYGFFKPSNWLLNSQLAFICSLFVTLASFLSYKRMIQNRLEVGDVDSRDLIDEMDDRFDLYDEKEEIEHKDLKAIIKEERSKFTPKKSVENLTKSIRGLLNPLRLLSYLSLFVSFMYLINSHSFDVGAYLIGLAVVPIGTLLGSIYSSM